MARPRKHDGSLFQKEESRFWWMDYRDRAGKRQRESTSTDDWEEAQKRLRERLQARDSNTLPLLRKGEELTFAQWSEHFLEAFAKPPIRARKTHLSYARVAKHLNAGFGEVLLVDLTADLIEAYLRQRLEQRVQITRSEGKVAKGLVKPSTVHQEFRVLRRMLNVAVRKKLLMANPCFGVEFPVRVKGLFRPHYMAWSEQEKIEAFAPAYLRNVIRIVTETGLRIYKELAPMRKEDVDLANAVVWIPDSKTPSGVAEVPLTDLAVEAFRKQASISGWGHFHVSQPGQPLWLSGQFQEGLGDDASQGGHSLFPNLRSPIDVRDASERWWRGRRMGHATVAPGRREGVQEVFTDEAADDARGSRETESQSERQTGFWHRRGGVKGFWHSFGTVGPKMEEFGIGGFEEALCFQRENGATRRG